MAPSIRLAPVLLFALAATPASAHPAAVAHGSPPSTLQLHLPLGRQANGSQPTFKLSPAGPRKTSPSPAPTPEFNPLKRRRIAMPALDPETQLAF
jgi:hypothetical protein